MFGVSDQIQSDKPVSTGEATDMFILFLRPMATSAIIGETNIPREMEEI